MKIKWKITLGAMTLLIVLGLIFAQQNKSINANLLEVKLGTIANTFTEEAQVIPEVEQSIYAFYGGKVIHLAVQEGQQVKQGQLLVKLDTKEIDYQIKELQGQRLSLLGEEQQATQEPYEAMMRSQQLQVEQAKRQMEIAEKDWARIEQLFSQGAVPKKELEDAANNLKTAQINLELEQEGLSLLHESQQPPKGTAEFYRGRIEALDSQLAMLQYKKEKHEINAYIDGIVVNLTVKNGQIIDPSQPLMDIFQKDSYLMECFVLTKDIPSIQQNMPVDIIKNKKGQDVMLAGTVTKIAATAVETKSALGLTEQRVKVTIQLDEQKNVHLFPGYNLDVKFTVDQKENVLVVPKSSLFPYKEGEALWVVRQGKAEIQPVTTGFEHNREIEVVSGLNAGDLVILNPHLDGLKEGRRINKLI